MGQIEQFVLEYQQGNMKNLNQLIECFKPLVVSWIKKIHQQHTHETEDYTSMAKIILLECAQKFDASRKVPFESYYKICLYHWYGNHMRKREIQCLSLENIFNAESIEDVYLSDDDSSIKLLLEGMEFLNEQEQDILNRLLHGQLPLQIAHDMHLAKKTILNKKYIIIKKMRTIVEKNKPVS